MIDVIDQTQLLEHKQYLLDQHYKHTQSFNSFYGQAQWLNSFIEIEGSVFCFCISNTSRLLSFAGPSETDSKQELFDKYCLLKNYTHVPSEIDKPLSCNVPRLDQHLQLRKLIYDDILKPTSLLYLISEKEDSSLSEEELDSLYSDFKEKYSR